MRFPTDPHPAPKACPMSMLADDTSRTDILNRLKRAEGQLRGIQRMVEEGSTCLDIELSHILCSVETVRKPRLMIGPPSGTHWLAFATLTRLEIGTSQLDRLDKGTSFSLRLESDDPEALPAALVRFWSSAREVC